jgi:hypothetical protein
MFWPPLAIIQRFSNTAEKLQKRCCNHGGAPHTLKLQIYFLPKEEQHDFKSTTLY